MRLGRGSVADVEDWLSRVGEALGVPVADVLPKDLRREMLGSDRGHRA